MKKSISILILSLCVLILIGMMIFIVFSSIQNEFVRSIRLQANGITQEKMEITGLDLKPGDTREYELNYSCSYGGSYDLSFVFKSAKEGGMERFLVVEVENGDRKVTVPFSDLLKDDNGIELTLRLDEKLKDTVYMRFIMPTEVGNEAQGLSADFYVVLTATHSEEGFI